MIIVTTDDSERTFNADRWQVDSDCTLTLHQDTRHVASYAPGAWRSVHHADADAHAASTDEHLAEAAYTAYCAAVGWKSFSGDRLPAWGDQLAKLREAWTSAAAAVRVAVHARPDGFTDAGPGKE